MPNSTGPTGMGWSVGGGSVSDGDGTAPDAPGVADPPGPAEADVADGVPVGPPAAMDAGAPPAGAGDSWPSWAPMYTADQRTTPMAATAASSRPAHVREREAEALALRVGPTGFEAGDDSRVRAPAGDRRPLLIP